MLISKSFQFSNTCIANPALRFIHDPVKAHIIIRVDDQPEISQGIANFLTIIEFMSAHHLIRNVGLHERFFNRTGLGIRPVQDCKVPILAVILCHFRFNAANHKNGFIGFALSSIIRDLVTGSIFGP